MRVQKQEDSDVKHDLSISYCSIMAESEGFEPSIRDKTYTPLAGARLQPLGQLSVRSGNSNRYEVPRKVIIGVS